MHIGAHTKYVVQMLQNFSKFENNNLLQIKIFKTADPVWQLRFRPPNLIVRVFSKEYSTCSILLLHNYTLTLG